MTRAVTITAFTLHRGNEHGDRGVEVINVITALFFAGIRPNVLHAGIKHGLTVGTHGVI